MAGILCFPELSLRHRPELFEALVSHPFEDALVEARFGHRRGWVVLDPLTARGLLLRRDVPKGRSAASREVVGGYPSLTGADFYHARSEVMVALARASTDTAAMSSSLKETIGAVSPLRRVAPAAYTRWMLHDLAGGKSTPIDLEILTEGVTAVTTDVEAAQAGEPSASGVARARDALICGLTERIDNENTVFLAELRSRGWSTSRIVNELIGLAVAGWESTAAAVGTAQALGMGSSPTSAEVSELLRLYPPSWLIVRQLTGDELWGAAGDLALVSPWLTHRSPVWRDAARFDPERTDSVAAFPFGVGSRRCPCRS